MRIAIIGAGPSGLATAAVLQACDHDVLVFEKAPDIGGVWSQTRAYPGVATQDHRVTYAFSDLPMPDDFPEHPSGAQVRGYLEHYARVKGIHDRINLGTRVESALPKAAGDGWVVEVAGPSGTASYDVDWLVVANGVFSNPHVPHWPGREEFEAHGGRLILPSELGDGAHLVDRRVVVVGWGKTACDIAAASAGSARSTTVVARKIRWKIPKRIVGGLTFRHLILTRLGEQIMGAPHPTLGSRVMAAFSLPFRRLAMLLLERIIARRTRLQELGVLPDLSLWHADSLVADGFFEAMSTGRLDVRRELSVERLGSADGSAGVRLSDGSWLPADVLVPATGYDQELSFFGAPVLSGLLDDDGVLALHRRILPIDVPRLAFAGWGLSYRSPVTAEIGAVWLAGHLAGIVSTPTAENMRRTAERYHLTHEQAAALREAQLPLGSFHQLDLLLEDLAMPLPARVRLRQWLEPLHPASYSYLLAALQHRLGLVRADTEPRTADRQLVDDAPGLQNVQ